MQSPLVPCSLYAIPDFLVSALQDNALAWAGYRFNMGQSICNNVTLIDMDKWNCIPVPLSEFRKHLLPPSSTLFDSLTEHCQTHPHCYLVYATSREIKLRSLSLHSNAAFAAAASSPGLSRIPLL